MDKFPYEMITIVIKAKAVKVLINLLAYQIELFFVCEVIDELLEDKCTLLLANYFWYFLTDFGQNFYPLLEIASTNQTLKHVISIFIKDNFLQIG